MDKMICIACPIGCHLEIENGENGFKVYNNKCNKGETYAKDEYFHPKRTVTVTIKLNNSKHLSRLPVKTDKPILKQHIEALVKHLYSVEVSIPVKTGDIIVENYENTGVNIIATRSVAE